MSMEKLMDEKIKYGLIMFLVIMTVCTFSYGAYHLNKWFNYKYSYSDLVKETIRQEVKPECLK